MDATQGVRSTEKLVFLIRELLHFWKLSEYFEMLQKYIKLPNEMGI